LDRADHRGVQHLVRDLNALYRTHSALWAEDFDSAGFQWIDSNDSGRNILSYIRKAPDGSQVAVVINFAGTPHEGYRLALPASGDWLELINTDSELYGGSGVGNLGRVHAEEIPWSGLEHSAQVRIPPLGAVFFAPAEG
jgi:1,4-alpha-glucan branching enzyme